MLKIFVPYGKSLLHITLPKKNVLDILYPKKTAQQESNAILAKAIAEPVDDHPLGDLFGTNEPILCIVNDATRPTRTAEVLDLLGDEISVSSVTYLIATGAHRAPTEQELLTIFGKHLEKNRHRIVIHNAQNERTAERFGKTRYGNELWLNRILKQFGQCLIIGSVEPHYFAGFTGGRKAILPGIAAYRTIEQNHKHATHPRAKPLSLIGNPVHEEMIDCVRALQGMNLLSIQMVLDRNHNIYGAFSGELERTFEMATPLASELYRFETAAKADIVVTVAKPPFDINLYQTLKAIEHGRMALKEGGILIVVSPCQEGLGPRSFARLFDDPQSIQTAAEKARTRYELGDHNAANLASLAAKSKVWMVTEIAEKVLRNGGIEKFTSLQRALVRATEQKGSARGVLFLMDGCFTVPVVD